MKMLLDQADIKQVETINDSLAEIVDEAGQTENRQLTVSFKQLFDLSCMVDDHLSNLKRILGN